MHHLKALRYDSCVTSRSHRFACQVQTQTLLPSRAFSLHPCCTIIISNNRFLRYQCWQWSLLGALTKFYNDSGMYSSSNRRDHYTHLLYCIAPVSQHFMPLCPRNVNHSLKCEMRQTTSTFDNHKKRFIFCALQWFVQDNVQLKWIQE